MDHGPDPRHVCSYALAAWSHWNSSQELLGTQSSDVVLCTMPRVQHIPFCRLLALNEMLLLALQSKVGSDNKEA